MATPQKPLRAALGKVGRALVKVGLPALGTAIGGPAGGVVAGAIGGLLGVDPADTDALEAAVASASPETLVRLREIEANVAIAEMETARSADENATARHSADMPLRLDSDLSQVVVIFNDTDDDITFRLPADSEVTTPVVDVRETTTLTVTGRAARTDADPSAPSYTDAYVRVSVDGVEMLGNSERIASCAVPILIERPVSRTT